MICLCCFLCIIDYCTINNYCYDTVTSALTIRKGKTLLFYGQYNDNNHTLYRYIILFYSCLFPTLLYSCLPSGFVFERTRVSKLDLFSINRLMIWIVSCNAGDRELSYNLSVLLYIYYKHFSKLIILKVPKLLLMC
jgi:hypothetical protein